MFCYKFFKNVGSTVVLIALTIICTIPFVPVSSATIEVTTTSDEDVDNTSCSLREAIIAANTDTAYHGCPAGLLGADTISIPVDTYTLGSQLPAVISEISIVGDYSTKPIIQAYTVFTTGINYRVFQVQSNGVLTLENLHIRYGYVNDKDGGAIFINGGSLNLVNAIISNNRSFRYGGGIWNVGGTLTVDADSVISYNIADHSGGGIYNDGGTVYVLGGTTINNNSATNMGGGIYNAGDMEVSEETQISANTANQGGGILNMGPMTVIDSTLTNNTASEGGGIYTNRRLTLTDSTLNNNHATKGGGVYSFATIGVVTFTGCLLDGNTADYGGAIYNNYSTGEGNGFFITDCVLSGNSASDSGGGIHNRLDGAITIDSSTLSQNDSIYGGGIWNAGMITLTNNNALTLNSASFGGGIYNSYVLNIEQSTIQDNDAILNISVSPHAHGGGVYNTGWMDIQESTISGNQAYEYAGGLWNSNTLTINRSTVSGNDADDYGGGIYNESGGILNVTNSTMSGNLVASSYGGGIYNHGTLNLRNSTLFGNTGNVFNGTYTTIMNISNTLMANSSTWYDCFIDEIKLGTNLNNLFEQSGCGNLSTSGLANSIGMLDYYGGLTQTHNLLPGSPAIDTGNLSDCTSDPVNSIDQRGVTRPVGSGCDIGAFEYDLVPELGSSTPADGAQLIGGITNLDVVFSKAVLADGSTSAADNPTNYLLVEVGLNQSFDTPSCLDGLAGDDVQIAVNSSVYNESTHTATLTVNGGQNLEPGLYRLFICGTTSIKDLYGLKLNYGREDSSISFDIYTSAVANFSGSPTIGVSPLFVTFTNTSTGDFDACLWDFGDGATSTDCAVTHTYDVAGIYSVSLTVSGLGGTDTMQRVDYITNNPIFKVYIPLVIK